MQRAQRKSDIPAAAKLSVAFPRSAEANGSAGKVSLDAASSAVRDLLSTERPDELRYTALTDCPRVS
jgi:hypothetical protein